MNCLIDENELIFKVLRVEKLELKFLKSKVGGVVKIMLCFNNLIISYICFAKVSGNFFYKTLNSLKIVK